MFAPSATQALLVAPARQTVVIQPGTSAMLELFVVNDQEQVNQYIPELDAFIADEDARTPIFGQADPAKRWVTIEPSQLELAPGEQGVFTFEVAVPENTPPMPHYFALFAKQQAPSGEVAFASRAGSLAYVYVAGDVHEELQLQEFSVENNILFRKEQSIFLQSKNIGNIHVIPRGEIVIKNSRDKVVNRIPINTEEKKILANNTWQAKYALSFTNTHFSYIGKNRAQLFIQYGFEENILVDEISFWYIPLWILIPGILIIFVGLRFFFIHRRR